jgi:putative thiamine transport system substrate-binding protein
MIARRTLLAAAVAVPLAPRAETSWAALETDARGGTVFWNAWAGDDRTCAFIAWVAERLRVSHDIAVRHVRLREPDEALARMAAGAPVDLVWINGPVRPAMRWHGKLLDRLPNAALVDGVGKPATLINSTAPVEGDAVPWRMAQLVFVRDSARVAEPPHSMAAMAAWAARHPGRLTHPTPHNFLGAAFLTQALVELAPDRDALLHPAGAGFGPMTAPLWDWYGALRPSLWRQGREFPPTGAAQRALLNAGEIDIMMSLNPSEALVAVANGTLPPSVRAFGLAGGTIGHCSFNAIPAGAANRPQALVLANFLLSPEAQAHAADPDILGSPTVLDLDRLTDVDRARFRAPPDWGVPLPEPHPSWTTGLVAAWERRHPHA